MPSNGTTFQSQPFVAAAHRMGFWAPVVLPGSGLLTGVAGAANDASHQRRGEQLPTLAGRGLALGFRGVEAAVLTTGLTLIPGIGPIAAGLVARAAVYYPNARFGDSLSRGFRRLSQAAAQIHRLEMGGRYTDTVSARASRLAAIGEMNATMVSSRRWLGSEAEIYHR